MGKVFSVFLLCLTVATASWGAKLRARGVGIPLRGLPGTLNAITDVPGVQVGQETIISGDPNGPKGNGPARTGVTAILPFGKAKGRTAYAGYFSLNGNGELTGTHWLDESGQLESAIVFTNTHSVGVARDAVVKWRLDPEAHSDKLVSLPVVGETWDGYLNDINGFHVKESHVLKALDSAKGGPVAEGNVGGGTGMVCFEFKCGIGTASRRVEVDKAHKYTVGVLVQSNFGLRDQLMIAGIPVGEAIPLAQLKGKKPRKRETGSILIAIATDAPLLPHQLKRVARRAALGLARTGSVSGDGSGDIFLAFSTAHPGQLGAKGTRRVETLANADLDPIFTGTVEAVEESILNALVAGETMTGVNGHTVPALPLDTLRQLLEKHGRLVPAKAR